MAKSRATQEQIMARREFDLAMDRHFRHVHLLSEIALGNVCQMTHFNVKRFAHWVNRRSKKITQEFAKILKSRFGTYGGLIPQRHFA